MGRLATFLLGISDAEVSFERRGFRGADEVPRTYLETVGRTFLVGYLAALADDRGAALAARLDATEPALRGFAYEGAAMGVTLLDLLQPWRRPRLPAFLAGPAVPHRYLAHVGVGWAVARLPGSLGRRLARLDPLLRWLVVDGYGFHQSYFYWPRAVVAQEVPRRVRGYARRAFDHGVGRSLWFVEGAGPARIAGAIGSFPASRRPDLWSGAGLACAYAGGVPQGTVEALREASGPHLPEVAQGAVFAAMARSAAGNVTDATELGCRVLCGMTAAEAVALGEATGVGLPAADGPADSAAEPAYEVWRRRIQEHFRREESQPWPEKQALSAAMR